MAKKKKNKNLEEVVVDEIECDVEDMSDAVVELDLNYDEPVVEEPKEECKKDGLATVMVMVNSIRYEGIIVRRGDHLKMCKEEAKAAAAAKRCIIL